MAKGGDDLRMMAEAQNDLNYRVGLIYNDIKEIS